MISEAAIIAPRQALPNDEVGSDRDDRDLNEKPDELGQTLDSGGAIASNGLKPQRLAAFAGPSSQNARYQAQRIHQFRIPHGGADNAV